MANNYTKTMRQALQEARSFRDVQEGFSTAQIKMAYGVLNDPRYKQGNYDGAVKAIEKIAKGLSDQPDVKNALKRANEEVELTEKKAEYLSLQMSRPGDAKRVERWLYKNMSQVNTPYDGPYLSDMNVEFENVDDADDLMAKLKRAGFNFKVDTREELDLPATGDTTTSNASQEVETVEEESTDEMFSTRSLGLKGASKRSRDKAREKDKDSEKSKKKEDLDEAKFTPAQISALQKAYAPLKGKTDYKSATGSKMNFNKLKNKMKSYSVSHLQQLSVADIHRSWYPQNKHQHHLGPDIQS